MNFFSVDNFRQLFLSFMVSIRLMASVKDVSSRVDDKKKSINLQTYETLGQAIRNVDVDINKIKVCGKQ